MFNFFGKRETTLVLYKPITGTVIDIKDTPDPVFAELYMGDGVAIVPDGNVIKAPCDGKVLLIAQTLHAIALESVSGLEVLIHIGLDTVHLQGEGFTAHVSMGDEVKKGQSLISFDRSYIEEQGKSLVTPVVITNMEKVKSIKKFPNNAENRIMEITVK